MSARRGAGLRGLHLNQIIALVAAVVCVVLFAASFGMGERAPLIRVAGIAVLALTCFATRVVPEIVTALVVFLLCLLGEVAPDDVVFSGFGTGGFWLLFAGIILGAAIGRSGLARRVSDRLVAGTGRSYPRAVLALSAVGILLGLLIPATLPRIIVLMPIAIALAEGLGYKPGERGHVGILVTASTMTLLPTYAILTANLPTIVQYGALETLYGLQASYGWYTVMELPVNLLRFGVLLALLIPFARGAVPTQGGAEVAAPQGPLTPEQRRLMWVLGVCIFMWATDFVHGISPAWVALAAAIVVLFPPSGLLDRAALKEKIDLSPAFFIAGLFAVAAVARHVGLDRWLGEHLIALLALGEGSHLRDLYAVFAASTLLSHLTTAPAAPLALAPFAQSLSEATGFPLATVAHIQLLGIATPILPYQAPPLIVAMSLAPMPMPVLFRICAILAAVVTVVGIPLTYLWWSLIGAI